MRNNMMTSLYHNKDITYASICGSFYPSHGLLQGHVKKNFLVWVKKRKPLSRMQECHIQFHFCSLNCVFRFNINSSVWLLLHRHIYPLSIHLDNFITITSNLSVFSISVIAKWHCCIIKSVWASSRETLSSGFATSPHLNQPSQL